jgi:hypothetical protein
LILSAPPGSIRKAMAWHVKRSLPPETWLQLTKAYGALTAGATDGPDGGRCATDAEV